MTEAEQAEKAKRQYQQAADEIRANTNLSDEGKRRELAAAYARQYREVERLHGQVKAGRKQTGSRLSAEVFGVSDLVRKGMDPSAVSVAYRDAQDRVARVETVEDAQRMLAQAERTGDETLARAVAARAVEMATGPEVAVGGGAWAKVANSYGESHPSWGMAVTEYQRETRTSSQGQLQEAFAFHPGDPGPEFRTMPRESVVSLGEGG